MLNHNFYVGGERKPSDSLELGKRHNKTHSKVLFLIGIFRIGLRFTAHAVSTSGKRCMDNN